MYLYMPQLLAKLVWGSLGMLPSNYGPNYICVHPPQWTFFELLAILKYGGKSVLYVPAILAKIDNMCHNDV